MKHNRARRWVEYTLLIIGVGALAVWGGALAINDIWQRWENRTFDRQIHQQPPTARAPSIGENALVGRLSIPRLNLSVMVREGTGAATLDLAVGHIPGTSFPGQPGNVAVAGHRDTLFRSLRKIRDDDLVRFETLGGNYEYRVKSTEIVKPEDVSVLKPGPANELTLVTCYPFDYFGSAPDRFIVKASQVPRPAPREADREPNASAPPPPTRSDPTIKKVSFYLSKNHSRELAPGISLGVTQTDTLDKTVNGWMWVMPDRRTIWLREHNAQDPVIFYGDKDGKKRELLITNVTDTSVAGYLLLPAQ